MTPHQVQLTAGVADNFVRKILIGQEHVGQFRSGTARASDFGTATARRLDCQRPGLDVVALDVRVQQFAADHRGLQAAPKTAKAWSSRPRSTTPRRFRPLHIVTPWSFARRYRRSRAQRYTFVECRVQSTIVNGPDGRPTQLTFSDEGYIDYFGRPWAQNWEEHFEQGWEDEPAR